MSSQILKIDKVTILLMTTPVFHPDNPEGGIRLSNAKAEAVVDPWLNMNAFDTAELLLNNESTPVADKTIQPGEENKRFSLFLPIARLHDGINRIRLRVKRISQDPETSEDLVVLFNTHRPGGDVTGTGDNLNLVMTLPADVIDKGLDADRVAEGVEVKLKYVYMRAHDKITLDCDGHTVLHTVTAAQAAAGTIVLKLFAEAFKTDNPRFAMRFRGVDQIGNSSGPQAIWSPTTHIDVHIRQPALDLKPPKVLEAKELDGTRLNFEKDFYEANFATVEVDFTGSALGQTVKVYWLGRNSTYGSEIQTVAYAGQVLKFLVPRLEVVDCIGSGAQISYTVRLPGPTEPLPSKDLRITVTAQKHRLPEPTLNSDKTNLRVYYPTLEGTYSVRMALFGITTRYGDEVPITQLLQTDLPVPSAWITENRGRSVMFNYTLKRTDTADPIIFSWCLRVAL
ncbi:hypothetical protein J2X84_001493 [Pseudomonas corrugata]|uniref:hypothetical protein n=1 Tax=Pseudomonas corrugata TaxID=47879 RepID=UPI00285A66D3|nr:hypothetical protein [Pseudomonas corrugata]MDR7282669.1 hypothetical protein [Pseudomonas corrugata]